MLFSSRMVLFYRNLNGQLLPADLPPFLRVERYSTQADLSTQDLQEITSLWNPDLALRRIAERFGLGASLWLIKANDNLAGYGWTLPGRTVEPHYFPLAETDVQFLDFHVLEKYRGRAIDWCLMTYVLKKVSEDGATRAFGEAAEWNSASLASFGMAAFRRLGIARKHHVLGRTFVCWYHDPVVALKPDPIKPKTLPRRKEQSSIPPEISTAG